MNHSHLNLSRAKDQFLETGFIRLDEMITQEEVQKLSKIYDQCFQSPDHPQRKALGGEDQQGRQTLPQILGPSKIFPELTALGVYERCRHVAAHFLDDPDVSIRGEHMILKPAGHGVATPWHQDQAYHDPHYDYRNINFWFPLDGATVEEGCLQFVPKSHSGPIVPHEYLISGNTQSAMAAKDQDYWSMNAEVVPCPSGSCTLHHSYCLHYAAPNHGTKDRRAFIIVYGSEPSPREEPRHFPWKKWN